MDEDSGWSVESGQDIAMGRIVESRRNVQSGRNEDTSQGCCGNSERGLYVFYVGLVLIGCFYAFMVNSITFSKFEVDTRVAIGGKYLLPLFKRWLM